MQKSCSFDKKNRYKSYTHYVWKLTQWILTAWRNHFHRLYCCALNVVRRTSESNAFPLFTLSHKSGTFKLKGCGPNIESFHFVTATFYNIVFRHFFFCNLMISIRINECTLQSNRWIHVQYGFDFLAYVLRLLYIPAFLYNLQRKN